MRISTDRQHLAEGGNLGQQGIPISPESNDGPSVRETDILAQERSDERIARECRSRIVRIGAMKHGWD